MLRHSKARSLLLDDDDDIILGPTVTTSSTMTNDKNDNNTLIMTRIRRDSSLQREMTLNMSTDPEKASSFFTAVQVCKFQHSTQRKLGVPLCN
jgi:hypothetical protein